MSESPLAANPYEVLGVAERDRWVIELPPEDLLVMPRADASELTAI